MATLKGVIILRISDFRRFFDFGEFWFKKEEFLALFKQEINRRVESTTKPLEEYFFVDDKKEFYLLQKVYDWLINPSQELPRVKLEASEVKIETNDGELLIYPLGRLQDYIETAKKQNQLTNKTILGYALLYLLLNANERNSNISVVFGNTTNDVVINKNEIKEFELRWDDVVLDKIKSPIFPLRRCVIINKNQSKNIFVNFNNSSLPLKPNECVVGLFCENKCYLLLDNVASDYDSKVTLKLSVNGSSLIPRCEVHRSSGVNYIEGVSSIAVESDGDIVYSTFDGKIFYNKECFSLDLRITSFLKKEYAAELLAFKKDGAGNYTFYTKNKINY